MVDELISKTLTSSAYWKLRPLLESGNPEAWTKAISKLFLSRLNSRYLEPIKTLQRHDRYQGEGFAISAIHCTLIEFLESTWQGTNYTTDRRSKAPYEYAWSGALFIAFLSKRQPFCRYFTEKLAKDFYTGVRCGLLHEARTKNGWRIRASHKHGWLIHAKRKILYRNNFHDALLSHVASYEIELKGSNSLQQAFLRKFDHLFV